MLASGVLLYFIRHLAMDKVCRCREDYQRVACKTVEVGNLSEQKKAECGGKKNLRKVENGNF